MQEFMALDRNLKLRALTVFLTVLLGASISPNVTIYYVQYFGAMWTGILLMIVAIGGLLASLYGGHVADVWGRKPTILIGQAGIISGYGLAAMMNSPWLVNPYITFIGFLLAAVGAALADPAEQAMMIDVSTNENRRFVFTLIYWIINVGVMIGAAIGGWFFRDHLFELLTGMTLVGITNACIVNFGMRESLAPSEEVKNTSLKSATQSYASVLKDYRYMIFATASMLASIVYLQPDYFLAAHLTKTFNGFTLGGMHIYGQRMLSLMIMANTILIILFMGIVSKATSKWRLVIGVGIGLFVQALGFAATFILQDFWPLMLGTVVFTFGEMIAVPASQTMRANMMDPKQIGAYSGVFSITRPVAAIFAGGMVSLSTFVNDYGMAAILMVIAFGAIALVYRASKMSAPFENKD